MSREHEDIDVGRLAGNKVEPELSSLLSSEQMLQMVLNGIPHGLFWKDTRSRYLGCNQVVVDAFGLESAEAIVGLDDHHLSGLTSEQAEFFIAMDRWVIERNEPAIGIMEQATLANGETIWMETNKFPMRDAAGNVVGILGTWQDITERKRAEAKLTERENQLDLFIQHSPVALAMFDRDMRYLHASRRWHIEFHQEGVELRGKLHYEVFPGLPERIKQAHQRGLNGETVCNEEDRFEGLDGTIQWLRWEVRPWFKPSGEVGGIVIFIEDITARKKAEEDQARLAAIVESCEDAIISKSLDGTILSWNAGAQHLLGYAPHEAIGQPITMIFPPERLHEESIILETLRRGQQFQHYETVRITKDGKRLSFSLTVSPIRNAEGTIVGISKIAREITAQKNARDALQQREALLRSATDNAAVGLVMLDQERKYIFVNAVYVRMFDLPWTVEELVGKGPADVLAEIYETQIVSRLDRAYNGETVTFEFTRHRTSQNAIAHFMVIYDPICDEHGTVKNVIVTVCDITERKQAEARLRESNERLEFALECSQIGAWDFDLESLEAAFRSLEHDRIYGYPEPLAKWTYATFLEHVLIEDRERVNAAFQKTIASRCDWNVECRMIRADKEIRWIWVSGRLRFDDRGVPQRIACVLQDITARKKDAENRQKLDNQIQHSQKLESLGVLAGGIAHDFNNILTSILGYTDLALVELPSHSTARAWITEAVNGACKAAELTKQMLAYSGKGKFVVQALNLNDVIEDMVHLLQVSISKKCVLKLHLMQNLPSVEADATQMRQIIMNLIINASEAIGERSGVIAITTGVMYCDRAYLSGSYLDESLVEGLYVFLEVADTGCGMPEEFRKRIFDPFFTTKTTGRGLGLAAVLGIVRGHRGAIKVYSEIGKGTTFKVAFAAVDIDSQLGPMKAPLVNTWRGSGTVLVVDDEESVRGILRSMLETMGFGVLTASDGREGVALFRSEHESIRLVVLDMTMPHLDGSETFRELRRIRSDVKAILTSGYNEQSAISQFAGKGLSGFIQKPFRYDELVAAVRRVIDCEKP